MARYREKSLAAAKLKKSTREQSKRQAVVHLLTAINWDWPLFPFPSVPIPPWAILLPSWASFRINSPPQQKLLLLRCAWLTISSSNTNDNFSLHFQSPSVQQWKLHWSLQIQLQKPSTAPSFPFTVPLHDCCHHLHSSVLDQQIVVLTASAAVFTFYTFCNLCH